MALAIREQIFGVPSGITYLQPTDVLSFDMRKGRKAQSTKALHQAVLEKSKNNPTDIFQLFEFEDHVTPTLSKKHRYAGCQSGIGLSLQRVWTESS